MKTKAKPRVSSKTRAKKPVAKLPKVAHSLFDYAGGEPMEAPSDPVIVEKIGKDIDAISLRLRSLDSESKLKLARRLASGANASSKHFNVAVFVADKPEDAQQVFAEPKPVEQEVDLL